MIKKRAKKSEIAIEYIVIAIIVLLVLGIGGTVFKGMTDKSVNYLLGKTNLHDFDNDIVDRFNLTKDVNKNAVDSVNALLFGINRLAYFDTYPDQKKMTETLDFSNQQTYEKYGKKFGDVEARPTYYDRETVFVSKESTLENAEMQIAIGTISCWLMFSDKGKENTRCYSIVFDTDFNYYKELDNLAKNNEFINYLSNNIDQICSEMHRQRKDIPVAECLSQANDLVGGSWYNIFNWKNINTGSMPADYFSSKAGKEIRICASNAWLNEVHFHTEQIEDACNAPTESMAFGYRIKGFSLPQEITKSSNPVTYLAEEWLYAYGDPNYILFYEKFPEEEAQYWELSNYQVAWRTIITVEGIFLGIDALTLGFGGKIMKVLKAPFAKLTEKSLLVQFKRGVTSLGKDALGLMGRVLRAVYTQSEAVIIRRQTSRAVVEAAAESVIKRQIANGLKKEVASEISEEVIQSMKTQYLRAFDEIMESSAEGVLKEGRLTSKGLAMLDSRFKELMAENNLVKDALGESAEKIIYSIGKELSQQAYDASFRAISREAVRTLRVAKRGFNLIKSTVLAADMTREAREKAVLNFLREGDSALKNMKPSELRTFIANQQKAKELLLNPETGEFLLKETEKIAEGATEAEIKLAAEKATKELDEILASKSIQELAPNTGTLIQSYSSSALGAVYDNSFPWVKKRHLVAGLAVLMAARIESMSAKYIPVGTNAIGLKTPYMQTESFDQFETGVNYTDINDYIFGTANNELTDKIFKHKKIAEDRMQNYGQPGYQGLLPEVNRYYLSLIKDKGLFDQWPQRFHLVSPCNTEILMEVSRCDCWYHEDVDSGIYETGKKYELMGLDENGNKVPTGTFTNVQNFDGENTMLYTLDEYGGPIKQCYETGYFQFDTLYKPKCIKINPQVENFGEYNYCYHGISGGVEVFTYGVRAAQIGLSFLGLFCGPAAPACMAGIGLVTGIAGEAAIGAVNIGSQWPNHD